MVWLMEDSKRNNNYLTGLLFQLRMGLCTIAY